MSTRKAYHRLILPSGEVFSHPVIHFDDEGRVLSWHVMEREEAFTEWVGGEFRLTSDVKD